jgi:hypothetical protein
MINKRVKISTVLESQLPSYVRDNYPLAVDFLKTYYRSQDSQSLPSDILSNIDQYIKVDNISNLTTQTSLGSSISTNDSTIQVSSTEGFPDQYGIVQIGSEIITYTGITTNTFTGCVRGFSGISSYHALNKPDELIFSSTDAASHANGSSVKNLSILFLQEFFKKVKKQIAPGFENRDLYSDLNQNLFVKQTKDFYASKGAEQSYEILFRALYGEDVELIRPSDYLFIPSDAGYRVTNDLVVEAISGNPELLVNKTLFQDKDQYHNAASATIANVEKIFRGDNTYYVLSLDADYGRDIDTVAGSLKGQFSINPKTRLLNNVAIGATVLDVDSTVGFAATGQIVADLPNGTSVTLTYLSKSSNQFFDVSGASQSLGETQELRQNSVAYGYTSTAQQNPVQVRIGAVLDNLVIPNETYLFEKDDKFEIQSLGKVSDTIKTRNWFYNLKNTLNVKEIVEPSPGSNVYNVETYDENNIIVGDTVVLTDTTGTSNTFTISQVINKKKFVVSGVSLPTNRTYTVQRQILKGNSSSYPYISNYITNVQNTYLNNDDVYVASNSIPSYSNQSLDPEDFSVTFSGSFSGTDLNIGSHPFYTGDAVEYVGTGLNIASGTYFVKVVNSTTIRLAASKPNISNNNFFSLSGTVSGAKLSKYGYKGKNLQPQKLIRLIKNPVDVKNKTITEYGAIGMFVNGVEALNYKSQDIINFGEINNVIVSAEGSGYDIINPPVLSISDVSGIGAAGKVSVNGGLERIEIIDPGIDYLDVPTITISGGNGSGAVAEASLMNFIHRVSFNSLALANQVDLPNNTVAFSEIHRLRDGERVFYQTNGGTEIGGLVDKSEYYVGVVDAFRVKFYKTFKDAIDGKNVIDLTSFGSGTHQVSTADYRKKVASIRVVNSGSNYENRYTEAPTTGINTASDTVKIENHGYNSGDIVKYSTTGNEILGLSTALSYYVTKVDENNFHLSNVGIGTTTKDQYYKAREFVDFRTRGSGTHSFNYEPISVKINGRIGLSTITTTNSIIIDSNTIRSGVTTYVAGVGQTGFNFNYTPRPNRPQLLDVFMNGVRLSAEDYESTTGTEIVLNSPTGGGEVLEMVSYGSTVRTGFTTVSAGAGQTDFPFLYEPGFIDVYYNGLKLPLRDYEADTGTSVILKEGAILNDVVELIGYPGIDKKERTYTAQAGQTEFTFPHQVEYGLVDVYINGIKLPTEDYDASNQSLITLYSPTSAGDVVYLAYYYLSELVGLGDDFNARIQPIFRGNIESVFLTNKGQNYGSRSILNYNRQPLFTLNSGQNAELIPVINQTTGGIQDVLIKNGGSGYNSPPNLTIVGSGSRAIVTPIVRNGTISQVIVINPGVGYDPNNTDILVSAAGLGAKFEAKTKTWNVNKFERLLQREKISNDDGVLVESTNEDLKYTHIYAPRSLREQVLGSKIKDGETIYEKDLLKDTAGRETGTTFHSPIIGWAYDGNPIYGPYGFDTPTGGTVRRMVSSYTASIKPGRPSISDFPLGFFVEDWSYDESGDLDEHNGRFCVTPEYPNGVYAYFATIAETVATTGPFKDYLPPVFPYLVGQSFYSEPIGFNFNNNSNQDSIDINSTQWLRNTNPYNITSGNSSYSYIFDPNKVKKQTSVVKYAQPGSLQDIDIFNDGQNYKVNNPLSFESQNGRGASAKISKIKGKTISRISVATTYVEDVEFLPIDNKGTILGIAPTPHLLNNLDTVSVAGISTYKSDLQRNFQVKVLDRGISLVSEIGTISATGIVTYFDLNNVPAHPYILENDILEIGSEQVKILNVDREKSRIRVLRAQNSTVGTSHSSATSITQKSRRVQINTNYKKSDSSRINRQFYFDPSITVALGATWGVGITSTLFFGSIENQSPVSIGTGTSTTLIFQKPSDINNFLGGGYVALTNPTNASFAKNKVRVLSVGSTSINVEFDTSALNGVGVTAYLNKLETKEVPTRTAFIKNHGLETGDRLIYKTNGGNAISVRRIGTSFQLSNNQELFVKKVNNDLVSLAQTSGDLVVDRNTLQFIGIGTGVYHSFETVRNDVIVGQIERNRVIVSTSSSHGLSLGDRVDVNVNVGITTTIKVLYNDSNRRTLINPRNFKTSDVNLTRDTIRINNHGFYTGQKVVFSTTTATSQLIHDKIYYVVVYDSNKIRLSDSYYDSRLTLPIFKNFTATFSGTIAPVNPQIKFHKNQRVTFDLSDSSLAYNNRGSDDTAFDFNLYTDENFENEYFTSGNLGGFNVTKSGNIGIDANAKLTLESSNETPEILYYALKPKFGINDPIKQSIIYDNEKINNSSTIIKVNSAYAGEHVVTSLASTSFSYTLNKQPEKSEYDPTVTSVNYETTSTTAVGAISSIRITSSGTGYFEIPKIANVVSAAGTEAILNGLTTSIGQIKTVKIEDIGFDYPTDNTLRPTVKLSNILKVERFSSFDSIGISSAGRGYTTPPDLVVLDNVTNEKIDVILRYELGDTQVSILKNTKDLYGVSPRVVPIHNSNGIGINTISYNEVNGDVVVTLVGSFATVGGFPFTIGDRVLVENVAITTTGRGYNSDGYNYSLFDVVATNPQYGGVNPTVTYNISSLLNTGEKPGSYDPINSAGRLVAEKDFPIFTTKLIENDFLVGEEVTSSNGATGFVDKWNPDSNLLKVLSPFGQFRVNDEIEGQTSGTKALIGKTINFESVYNIGSSSKVEKGWKRETGFLNNSIQRIQDSDYYQYFSYSLKSKVSLETWDEPVQSLNHPAGYKKFSNLLIDTSSKIGIATDQNEGDFSAVADIISVVDTNCYFDWDLVDENFKYIVGNVASDEIIFNSRLIQNYFESIGNRVLSIDDVSGQFNSDRRVDPFSTVDEFPLSQRFKKYITYVKDKRFTNERQVMLVSLLHDGQQGYLNQYGRVETSSVLGVFDLGSFDFSIRNLRGNLDFYPVKSTVNNYDVSLASYDLIDTSSGIGSTSVGSVAQLYSTQIALPTGFASTTLPIVSIAETHRAARILVSVSTTDNQHQYDEISLLRDNNRNVYMLEYGQLTDETLTATSTSGFGTYDASVPRRTEATVALGDYFASSGVTTSTGGSGSGPFGGFAVGDHTRFTGDGNRQFTLRPIDARNLDKIIVRAVVGNDSNGGERPESNEPLHAYYSINGGVSYVDFGLIVPANGAGTLQNYSLTIPDVAKTVNTLFRIRQQANSGNDFDNYGVTQVTFESDRMILDFYPNAGVAGTVNVLTIGMGITQATGVGSMTFNTNTVETIYTGIGSTSTPVANRIAGWSTDVFNGAYLIVGVEDSTNNEYEFFEMIAAQDDIDQSSTEYGILQTSSGLGTVGIACTGVNLEVLYTPNPNIDVNVRVWQHTMRLVDNFNQDTGIGLTNAAINSGSGEYTGTELDIKRDFPLQHRSKDIFQKYFNPTSDPRAGAAITTGIVNLDANSIKLEEHFFVTGEEVTYTYPKFPGFEPIGIATTTIAGVSTDKLPEKLFIVKLDAFNVKVAASATAALAVPPSPLDITSSGIGISHRFVSKKQDQRVIITIDDLIQSPIVSTSVTTHLTTTASTFDDIIEFNNITDFQIADLIKIDEEICLIDAINSSNSKVTVRRGWMGTNIGIHTTAVQITKIKGNYNIVDNTLNFVDAPYGPSPIGTITNAPDDRDYTGITTTSTFGGRAFMKSSANNSSTEPYNNNYIFKDLSDSFNGIKTDFTLNDDSVLTPTSVTGIATDNAIILLNGIFQSPTRFGTNPIIDNQYIVESSGISSIFFNGAPVGGEIVSVGSTKGFGYQPLVSAGGTAIVSIAGTISSIAIGNSGSGYRSGIQTTVNVSVATSSLIGVDITKVGIASVLDGIVVSIAITNPGTGYTSSNPPHVIIDDPFPYENLELQYASGSTGVGTGAKVSVVVGQGSSVIDFELTEVGRGYEVGDILTFAIGGMSGIPTDTTKTLNQFQLTVTDQYQEQFNGWSIGNLTVFDTIDNLFDGFERRFALKIDGVRQSIIARDGSGIDVAYTLLIFLNGVLQKPNEAYEFDGGSTVIFTEPPRVGDNATVLFYQGNKDIDVVNKDILETVKVGDTLQIYPDEPTHRQNKRTVFSIDSIDVVTTNTYNGPGILTTNTPRSVIWCKQRSDKLVNGNFVAKNREEYESLIFPTTNIIKDVSTSDNAIFVENARTFFDSVNENPSPVSTRTSIQIIDQSEKVSAAATAVISGVGSVTSVSITNSGIGYTQAPIITFESPVGLGTTSRAEATATISGGKVTTITVTNTGTGYTQAPTVLIESPSNIIERIDNVSYTGDFGIISGIKTTSIGIASTGVVFDLYIPENSFLRDTTIVGTAITLSGIQNGYYFVVSNTNIGNGVTSLNSSGAVIMNGTENLNNVYEAISVSIGQSSVPGIGVTEVAQVVVSLTDYNGLTGLGYSGIFGEYSWARIAATNRGATRSFAIYNNGLSGIETSPIVRRLSPLENFNYNQ